MSGEMTVLGCDGIRRSFDEHYDTLRDVEQDLTGAMWAIHKQATLIAELEAKLDKAMKLIEYAIELGRWDLNPSLRDDLIDFSAELKGEIDE